ncbi:kyphoscoliosis peptidase-like [Saccostrea echinata]|uniref:kyphoscoliosis peptidase-like n=1 Tax=Saccostrea echinata TaxID=191078 RepID=UPI002A82C892|nr:kyphoscoliosis peptidase-like [Saccostrea echinata]
MGCGSSSPTTPAPVKNRDKGGVLHTSEVTEEDFEQTVAQPTKTIPYSNGMTIQTNNSKTNHVQNKSNAKPEKTHNSSSRNCHDDDLLVENLEEVTGSSVIPKPSRKKKSQIIPNSEMFKAIDSHVARTPASVCSSIATLAEYLLKPAHTPLERARAIHKWITTNIMYDIDGYMGRSGKKSCDSADVLKNRSSVCSGYSNLFESLCRCAHIPVMVITGYGKGFGHNDKQEVDISNLSTNHAWNAIFLEGEWRLLDCTWDAGYVDGKSFHWHKRDYYFLMDPEYFVSSHLPLLNKDLATSEPWQLLDKPVDPKTFFKSLKLEDGAVNHGIFPLSHKETVVHVNGETCIEIQKYLPGDIVDTLISFVDDENNKEYEQCVATERSGNEVIKFHVRPPKPGIYRLSIFVNAPKEEKKWPQLFKYIINCTSALENLVLFPNHRQLYGPKHGYTELGFDRGIEEKSIYSTSSGELEISLPTLRQMSVLCTLESQDSSKIQNAVFQQSTANSISLSARLPKTGNYKLIVFASKEKEYVVAITFMIQCTNVLNDFKPYPVVYGSTSTKYQVILYEPKVKGIPANTPVVFKFSSPVLKSVQVGSKVFLKANDSDVWEITFDTPDSGVQVNLFGGAEEQGKRDGLFGFLTV